MSGTWAGWPWSRRWGKWRWTGNASAASAWERPTERHTDTDNAIATAPWNNPKRKAPETEETASSSGPQRTGPDTTAASAPAPQEPATEAAPVAQAWYPTTNTKQGTLKHKPCGGQIPQPKFDDGRPQKWDDRGPDTNKFVTNHRNGLMYQLKSAEQALEKAIEDYVTDPELGDIERNVAKQYTKIVYMDRFHTMLFD